MSAASQRSSRRERLLVRWGARYIGRVTLLVQITSFLAASLGIYYIMLNVTLNQVQLRHLIQSVFVLVVIANLLVGVYSYRISPQARARLAAWAKTLELPAGSSAEQDTSEQEQAAWREITAYPWRYARFSAAIALFQVILPAAYYMHRVGGLSPLGSGHVVIGGIISAGGLILYFFFALEWLLEPVYQILLPRAPTLRIPAGLSVHSRLLIVYISLGVISLLMVGALAYQKAINLIAPGVDPTAILRSLQTQLALVGAIAILLMGGFSYLLARSVSEPIRRLIQTMTEIEAGHLRQRAAAVATNELGHLALAFNRMVAQLETFHTELEQRVAERTTDLAQRSAQLAAAAQVAREAAAIRDVPQLLDETVRLISDRFDFYHAGIFLIDATGEYAVLHAASSEGGGRMLERGHRLAVGKTGIVGYVANTGEPRIALDVGKDAVFFDNPDLPLTRSEMALPLKVHERTIGVLDVQSTQAEAFSREDVAVLQTLADQVALAIENARLLEESQRSLHELESLYGQRAHRAWQERTARQAIAYRYTPAGLESVPPLLAKGKNRLPPHATIISKDKDERQLIVPVRLRGHPIGSLVLRRNPEEKPWSPEETALAEAVVAQAALALENARLLDETRLRAQREEMVGQIASRIRSTLDMDTVLQTAVAELGKALGLAEAEIHLGSAEEASSKKDGGSPS